MDVDSDYERTTSSNSYSLINECLSESPRSFDLAHSHASYQFDVPFSCHSDLERWREEFLGDLSTTSKELHLSQLELATRFLGFLVQQQRDGSVSSSPGSRSRLEIGIKALLESIDADFLDGSDIASAAAKLQGSSSQRDTVVMAYQAAVVAANKAPLIGSRRHLQQPALFASHENDKSRVTHLTAVCGGQGNTLDYFGELRHLFHLYPNLLMPLLARAQQTLHQLLADASLTRSRLYGHGMEILQWLQRPETTPESSYLLSAPVSFPLIGLVQLANYGVVCHTLGKTPGEVSEHIEGWAGHSQGIVAAAYIATATTWESLEEALSAALQLLFHIGAAAQEATPCINVPSAITAEAIKHGEGQPTPMLNVSGCSRAQLDKYLRAVNGYLDQDQHVGIALVNGATNFVVAGPVLSLCALTANLRRIKAAPGLDQSKIAFSLRKPEFSLRFLPISAPFHSPHLIAAVAAVEAQVGSLRLAPSDLQVAVSHSHTGQDLRDSAAASLVPQLVRMILCEQNDWPLSTTFGQQTTHIVDFGPGGLSGVGWLLSRNKDGTGVRVLVAGLEDDTAAAGSSSSNMGFGSEIFAETATFNENWAQAYAPRLLRSEAGGRVRIENKMTRLLGLPPIMVAGMTPTTCSWEFVGSIMQAGYHAELAAGGMHSAEQLTASLRALTKVIPAGRGICVNVIYASPRQVRWQIPLIQKLRSEGAPIDGLTFGAGVPSVDAVKDYMDLGLRYLSFKPGSALAIKQVISIAQSYSTVPILMQWTGGRGGGHHSYEDFHDPILKLYSRVRTCKNIVLLAGSGFGGANDTYAYLSGQWSVVQGHAPMPFDGILLGSRVMVAKEAKTGLGAKQAIVAAPGVDEEASWEQTYQQPTGGIITVVSEMGEPIHKLATRGVLLWKELDDKIFSIKDKPKRLEKLRSMRSAIIKRLNEDFQKVWFGLDSQGNVVDLEDMTYGEILRRLVHLLYVSKESRWIDQSYIQLTTDFARRFCSRLGRSSDLAAAGMRFEKRPLAAVEQIVSRYPKSAGQVINFSDARYFILLCKRQGQKPPPFVPTIDDDFETWFKKDSLWQSEDLAAIVDGDADRTCILQGPVAAKYSTTVDEPVGNILNDIEQSHVTSILRDRFDDYVELVPVQESVPPTDDINARATARIPANCSITVEGSTINYRIPASLKASAFPDMNHWLRTLAGEENTWLSALLLSVDIWQDSRVIANPMRRDFAPVQGLHVQVHTADQASDRTIAIMDPDEENKGSSTTVPTFLVRMQNDQIVATFFANENAMNTVLPLNLRFTYHPETALHPIHEIVEKRKAALRKFYYQLWFGAGTSEPSSATTSTSPKLARIPPSRWPREAPVGKPGRIVIDTVDAARRALTRAGPVEPFTPLTPAIFRRDTFTTTPTSSIFKGRDIMVSADQIEGFNDSIQQSREVLISARTDKAMAPLDFAIVVGWEAMMKATFHTAINGEFLALVHLSNKFTVIDDSAPLSNGDQIHSKAEIRAIRNESAGRVVEVCAVLERLGRPVLSLESEFLFRGSFLDFDVCFEKKSEEPICVDLDTAVKVAVLKSKPWFRLLDPSFDLTGRRVTFELHSMSRPASATRLREIQTVGHVLLKDSVTNTVQKVATVSYHSSGVPRTENPVMGYLRRHGSLAEPVRLLTSPQPLGESESMTFTAPASNTSYARASSDFNPIHVSLPFARYANLPGTLTHGMYTSAAVRRLVEQAAGANEHIRMRSYKASFVNMVLPGDTLEVRVTHTALKQGQRILSFQAVNVATGQVVVEGKAEVDQPSTAYIFTGQGSQSQNMGMDLYETSSVARAVWDEADHFFSNTYGFRLSEVVRHNPRHMTVHFGGRRGRRIRQNYLDLTLDNADGSTTPLFPHLNSNSTSHTFQHTSGLLFSTEFVQPALTTLERAQFLHLKHNCVTTSQALFAGHSLGEYTALCTIGEIMPFDKLLTVVFFRGLSMQSAVVRDSHGRSQFAMMAVNPSRVCHDMSTAELHTIISRISSGTNELVEIVNHNVVGQQYVVAGALKALGCLGAVTDHIAANNGKSQDSEIDRIIAAKAAAPPPTELQRGTATIPLPGIDVPFHSSFLLPKMPAFRRVLQRCITPASIDADLLVGKYISNVTGKAFDIAPDAIREAYEVTKSSILKELLVTAEA